MVAHEEGGGWALAKPHITLLMDRFPDSQDVLQCLIEEEDADSVKATAKAAKNCKQLAVMLERTKEELDKCQWSHKLEWNLPMTELSNRTSHNSPSQLSLPGGRLFTISLQNPSGRCSQHQYMKLNTALSCEGCKFQATSIDENRTHDFADKRYLHGECALESVYHCAAGQGKWGIFVEPVGSYWQNGDAARISTTAWCGPNKERYQCLKAATYGATNEPLRLGWDDLLTTWMADSRRMIGGGKTLGLRPEMRVK